MSKPKQRQKCPDAESGQANLPHLRRYEKFYIEVDEASTTGRAFLISLRQAKRADVQFVRVRCADGSIRKMLDAGYAFTNKVDKLSRLNSQCKGRFDFAVWNSIKGKPACLLRTHGRFNEIEMRSIIEGIDNNLT